MAVVGKGKATCKRDRKRKCLFKDKGSDDDDSDDDYMAEEDEVSDGGDASEDYCASFEADELDDHLGDFEADNGKKVVASRPKKSSLNRRGNESNIPRNRKRVSYSEEIDDGVLDDEDDGGGDDDDDDDEFRPDGLDGIDEEEGRTAKRRRVACNEKGDGKDDEEEEEYDFNDDDDEEEEDYDFDDEEFTEEVDSFDEDEDVQVMKKVSKPAKRQGLQKKGSVKTRRRKRARKVRKKTSRKKATRNVNSRRNVKNCDDDGFFTKKTPVMIEESGTTHVRRKKRSIVQSDSDFATSGASDCDFTFTISEEEREQVREASKLCKTTTSSLRSSSTSKKIEENVDVKLQIKPPVRKGKEKVEIVKNDVVKQVCGICLSDEGKRTVRGTLNCCSHYFCFACIIEWSKVETRCPLCKQRFLTISKPVRSSKGIDLRDVVTQVPQRDQIYQPSEEEIRGYLDPYEHVMCSECQHGGDDNLMLLCDLCDSPAHTYCVGLGREVPEGNWYCEGCRPVALASLMSQHPHPDQTPIDINISHRSSTSENMEYGQEPTTMPSQYSRGGFGGLPSPRYSYMDGLSSPRSGPGASTVSARRNIHRQVHSIRARQGNGRFDNNLNVHFGSEYSLFQADQGIETTPYQLPRSPIAGTSSHNFLSHPSRVQDGGIFPARSDVFPRHVTLEAGSTASGFYDIRQLQTGIHFIPDHVQHNHYNNGSIMDSDQNVSLFAKGIVESMVESYLESISKNMVLDQDIAAISRRSTHTILAACGCEHQPSEVSVSLIQTHLFPKCYHVETTSDRQISLMKGCCSPCFEAFVRHVVKTTWNEHVPGFLWVRD